MADVSVNTSDLRNFSKAVREASKKTGREFHDALKRSAEIVAAEARGLAGSDKIAKTIKAGAYGASAYVQIGDKETPEAVLREVGNTSSHRAMLRAQGKGKFWHPTFGNRDAGQWQNMHPAVGPAALANEDKAIDELTKGVNKAFSDVHLEME